MLATVLTTGAMMVRSEVEGVSGFRRGGCTCNFDSPVVGCLAVGGCARVSVCGSLVGFALGFPNSVEWRTNGWDREKKNKRQLQKTDIRVRL